MGGFVPNAAQSTLNVRPSDLRFSPWKRAVSEPSPPTPPPPPPQVAWTLQTLSANALELSGLWERSGFGAALLVDVDKPAFTSQLPMQVG